jgi:hypothetical protein
MMDRKKFLASAFSLPFLSLLKAEFTTGEAESAKKTTGLKPTCDPYVFITEQSVGYTKYIEKLGDEVVKIWEVHGICTGIGKCYEGAANEKPILDCPVNEYFKKDCCPLKVVVLYKK